MKASLVALAASSLLGSAVASVHHRHEQFHAKRDLHILERGAAQNATCGCTYSTSIVYGAMTLASKPPPAPTPIVSTFSSPGTYTISKSTITLTETTTVASAATATLTPGEGTYGGLTTSVPAPMTVTAPIGTVEGTSPVTTSIVKTTTHFCSEAGTCVIGPTSTSVSVSTVMVYPVPATYKPGTYTIPESTITVTATNTIYVCPFASVTPTPSSTPAPAPSISEAPETTSAPVVKPQAYSPPAAPEAPSSSPLSPVEASPAPKPAAPKPAAAKPQPKPPGYGGKGGSAPVGANGNKWALAYTPYGPRGTCKSPGEVESDIAQIAAKGFSSVRLYATDCSGLQNVGRACKNNGMKLIAGVFIEASGIGPAKEQLGDIIAWGSQNNWNTIEMIVLGNEAIFNGYVSAGHLAGFITSAKATLKAAGYSGPCTTTEPLGTLMANKDAICGVVDVVAANIQPFFNTQVSASEAGGFVASQLELTGQQCPGKTAYNLECGWPWQGQPNGKAVPGPSQQEEAIGAILGSSAASRTVIFSFENDAWKGPGDFGVEPYFGCVDVV